MQLQLLLPDNKEYWREYRPDDLLHGKKRYGELKRSKEYHIKKHSRRRSASKTSVKAVLRCSSRETMSDRTPPSYNPTCHYESTSSPGTVSDISLLQLTQKNVGVGLSHEQSQDGLPIDLYSDKEVVMEREIHRMNRSQESVVPAEGRMIQGNQVPEGIINSSGESFGREEVSELEQPSEETPSTPIEPDIQYSPSSTLKRPHSKVSSAGSSRSFSSRVSSKLSRPFSFVNSVISSDSWRSSLIYQMSISSGRLSNSHLPWSAEELESWHELVDESLLGQSSSALLQEVNLLQHRPCCSFFKKNLAEQIPSLCQICGFSPSHFDAQSSYVLDGSLPVWVEVVRFGNNSLHHAAASGNLRNVMELVSRTGQAKIDSNSDLNYKNTSRETFLHVIQVRSRNDFDLFSSIVKEVSNRGFNFKALDHKGSSIN